MFFEFYLWKNIEMFLSIHFFLILFKNGFAQIDQEELFILNLTN